MRRSPASTADPATRRRACTWSSTPQRLPVTPRGGDEAEASASSSASRGAGPHGHRHHRHLLRSARPRRSYTDADDVSYLLDLANSYFPDAKLVPERRARDVGRPAAAHQARQPTCDGVGRVARAPHPRRGRGLVTIAGGKLTTYRRMAAEVVDHAGKQLGDLAPCGHRDAPAAGRGGADLPAGYAGVTRCRTSWRPSGVVDAAVAKHLANTYGARARVGGRARQGGAGAGRAARSARRPTSSRRWTSPSTRSRRTPSRMCSAAGCSCSCARAIRGSAARAVARRMAARLGWDEARTPRELEHYRGVVAGTMRS